MNMVSLPTTSNGDPWNVDELIFRFNYYSPSCSPNSEPSPSSWVSYTGSNLLAQWDETDFCLLKLDWEIDDVHGFAGWDRTSNTDDYTNIKI